MSKMKKQFVWLLAAMMALTIAGCANQKVPAEQAIAGAETALAAVRDQAQKYVPDQLQAVDAQIASAKDAFSKGDYKGVLAAAPAITTAISSLKDAASAKAADAEAALSKAKDAWSSVSTDVPKMVDAIQSRVDMLSKSHHLPANVSKDSLAAAKSGLDSLKSMWSDASSAASSGDYTGAMAKAQAVKDKATDIMKSLGMTS
jgi:predicted small lipoprotein YifL